MTSHESLPFNKNLDYIPPLNITSTDPPAVRIYQLGNSYNTEKFDETETKFSYHPINDKNDTRSYVSFSETSGETIVSSEGVEQLQRNLKLTNKKLSEPTTPNCFEAKIKPLKIIGLLRLLIFMKNKLWIYRLQLQKATHMLSRKMIMNDLRTTKMKPCMIEGIFRHLLRWK